MNLESMRHSIDNIDNALVAMLAERFKITDAVGHYKAKNQLPAKDEAREAQQYERIAELAEQYALDPNFAKQFLEVIMKQSVENHLKIAEQYKK
ncbi:chorismate mutase [Marinomonas spartinae]|uniref:chorismate mutase n=1 Tax=Marinomonas spartinae TaxID=1792290 RepID=UPI0018F12822|nr:chorismate mutase [Marinomonas spartinae]MBJ7555890.1 chorismate mutase [Marinomonas spartinae]